ncbi:MAG: hypothetical protein R2822_18400 [Spirosomataceae bacterium]
MQWILKNQYQDESSKNYGIWKTSIVNDKFDQNWREFIGCDLIIIQHKYSTLLSHEMLKEIETGLIHAARGAMRRNVGADYTNISIMSAFLMEYVGTAFKIDELKNAGLRKAQEVYKLYRKYNTFSEYNSPTYYGVTLVALALWRELAFSKDMREMGRTLEKEFWHEVATFYNPHLKNMPGPYFRGYGMDMKKYWSITGIWIALALDDVTQSPTPQNKGPKYGEMSNLIPILNVGLAIPQADLARLSTFSTRQFIQRTVPNKYLGDSLKQVTATVHKDWMMGGVWGSRRVWNQIKTGTIHWKMSNGDTGWLLVPGDGNTNVKVDNKQMILYAAHANVDRIEIYLHTTNGVESFSKTPWVLSGLQLGIKTNLKTISIENIDTISFQKQCEVAEKYDNIIKVVYDVPTGWNVLNPLIVLIPQQ